MKYMIISDIHGSGFYLEKSLEIYKEDGYDKLLILGDILYHGPRNPLPKGYDCQKVFSLLNQYKDEIICVKGNCDSEVDQMVLEFPILDSYSFVLGNRTAYLTHGHKYNIDHIPSQMRDLDLFFYGHFHVPLIEEKENKVFCNPGSISLPKQDSKNSYISLTEHQIQILDLDRNIIFEKIL